MSAEVEMGADAVLRAVDAVTVPVPDLDQGLACYRDALGHELIWRNDEIGQAGLRLPDGQTEIVLSTSLTYAPNWLVASVPDAVARILAAGGAVVVGPHAIAVGRLAVVTDPFGNALILLDLSRGRYAVDDSGQVTGIDANPPPI
jgi:predicted enzyme related to lactoylglutathione lyase